jgi:asparagine synthase (glutamine-hydrolysing)
VKTFAIGFDEPDFDELSYARLVAKRYGTEHVEMVVKADVVNVLPRLAWQFDEPFADASAVPTYCVSRITREHVTVALSGDGGDESFAGYRRYAEALRLHRRMDSLPLSLAKPLLRSVAAAMPAGARGRRFIQMLGLSPVERYHRMMTCEVDESFGALLRPGVAAGSRPGSGAFAELALQAGSDDYLSTLQYLDVRRYLPEDILTKVDRTSMLTSLETRVPLLDHVLMEHVARMPARMKMRNGSAKWVLKETMRDALPAEILNRRKMGFGVPLAGWFRKELRDFSRDVLLDSRARQRGILRTAAVEGLLAAHQEGPRDFSSELWSLICFELWCRTWWDR